MKSVFDKVGLIFGVAPLVGGMIGFSIYLLDEGMIYMNRAAAVYAIAVALMIIMNAAINKSAVPYIKISTGVAAMTMLYALSFGVFTTLEIVEIPAPSLHGNGFEIDFEEVKYTLGNFISYMMAIIISLVSIMVAVDTKNRLLPKSIKKNPE